MRLLEQYRFSTVPPPPFHAPLELINQKVYFYYIPKPIQALPSQ